MRRAGVVYYANCERKGRWEPPAPPDVLSGWVQVRDEISDTQRFAAQLRNRAEELREFLSDPPKEYDSLFTRQGWIDHRNGVRAQIRQLDAEVARAGTRAWAKSLGGFPRAG